MSIDLKMDGLVFDLVKQIRDLELRVLQLEIKNED